MGRWANKYVIGLTGNIAMGKSLVRKMLENLGAYTIDADGLAHQAMAPGAPAYAPIIDSFGKWILDADKKIDRSKLGAVAFSHNEALNQLEKLTHPVVGQAIDILISRAKQPIVVVEAIKLVDGVLGDQVDSVWVVDATPENQLQRLITRRNMADWEAHKRIDTQNPQKDKLAKAKVVINNNGSPEEVWAQVQREWAKITAVAKQPAADEVRTVNVSKAAQDRDLMTRQMEAAAPSRQPAQPPATVAPSPAVPPSQAQPAQAQASQMQPAAQAPAAQAPTRPAAQPTQAPPQPQAQPAQSQPQTQAQTPIKKITQTLTQPPAAPAASTPVAAEPITKIDIRRGLPKNAEAIARLLTQYIGKQVSRMDIMMAFGEKSYLLAEAGGKVIGLAGFQVENLITRMDEFVIIPEAPVAAVTEALIGSVEEASKELQSEVGFMFMPRNAPQNVLQAFFDQGYERIEIDALKVPAWREAAAESQSADKQILMKKLRAERVLKPV